MTKEQQNNQQLVRTYVEAGMTVREACRKACISMPTYYSRKRKEEKLKAHEPPPEWTDSQEELKQAVDVPNDIATLRKANEELKKLVHCQALILSGMGIVVSLFKE